MKRVYLDYGAATPPAPEVLKAIHVTQQFFSNPSAVYTSARKAKELLEQSRKQIAMFFGANTDEIVFTSGATESNNLALLGAARAAGKGQIISIQTEHMSVREPIAQLQNEGFKVDWCSVDAEGQIDIDALQKLLSKQTILVSIAYANSEIGTIVPIAKIAQVIRTFEKTSGTKILLHTDASGAATQLSCDISRLGVDMLTIGGTKLYGPKGIGLLYIRRNTKLMPVIFGSHQEQGLRSGSQNLPGVVGLKTALNLVQKQRTADSKKYQKLYSTLQSRLQGKIDYLENGSKKNRLYSIMSLCLNDKNGEDLVAYLDKAGYEVSTGAACEATNAEPSHVLLAIGRTHLQAKGSLRISFGRETKHRDVKKFATQLIKILSRLS